MEFVSWTMVAREPRRITAHDSGGGFGHKDHDRVWCGLIELRRVCTFPAEHVPRELDHSSLHSNTDPKIGGVALAAIVGHQDFPFNATISKTSRDENAVNRFQ